LVSVVVVVGVVVVGFEVVVVGLEPVVTGVAFPLPAALVLLPPLEPQPIATAAIRARTAITATAR
jgi:hypothetical protein